MSDTPSSDFSGLEGGEDQAAEEAIQEVVNWYNIQLLQERRAPVPDEERIEELKAGREAAPRRRGPAGDGGPGGGRPDRRRPRRAAEGAQGVVARSPAGYGQGPDGRVRPAEACRLHPRGHQRPGERGDLVQLLPVPRSARHRPWWRRRKAVASCSV
ncbi:hypothetical protein LT493_29570 [Streptomyces tricolor]|nr:hypothetical protein [Streptomyces tricolor]